MWSAMSGLKRLRKVDCREFETSLGYRVSTRLAWSIANPISPAKMKTTCLRSGWLTDDLWIHKLSRVLTWVSFRMKFRRSPCFIYGRTTSGDPSLRRQIPKSERTLGWLKSFMMIPSVRNWETSPMSVIPVECSVETLTPLQDNEPLSTLDSKHRKCENKLVTPCPDASALGCSFYSMSEWMVSWEESFISFSFLLSLSIGGFYN